MSRCLFSVLILLICLLQGCAHEQLRTHRLCNHPNLLVCAPSKIGAIGGGVTLGLPMAGVTTMCCIVALPFGYESQVEAFFDSTNMASVGTITGTYLVGGPFYLLFGWWGPGNLDTETLKMQITPENGRLQFLHYYHIRGKDLKGVNLSGLDLRGCNLQGIDFSGANLSQAKLSGCDLEGAVFKNANLTNAEFQGAYLIGADLRDADLSGANLSGPGESAMYPTCLDNVKLEGANLSKANFQRVKGLSQDELHRAKNWQNAQLN